MLLKAQMPKSCLALVSGRFLLISNSIYMSFSSKCRSLFSIFCDFFRWNLQVWTMVMALICMLVSIANYFYSSGVRKGRLEIIEEVQIMQINQQK